MEAGFAAIIGLGALSGTSTTKGLPRASMAPDERFHVVSRPETAPFTEGT
jgi:hypothetical protein